MSNASLVNLVKCCTSIINKQKIYQFLREIDPNKDKFFCQPYPKHFVQNFAANKDFD